MYAAQPMHVLELELELDYLLQRARQVAIHSGRSLFSSARLDDANIERIMKQPKWRFGRISYDPPSLPPLNATHSFSDDATNTTNVYKRAKCNTCTLRANSSCVKMPGKDVCSVYCNILVAPKCA